MSPELFIRFIEALLAATNAGVEMHKARGVVVVTRPGMAVDKCLVYAMADTMENWTRLADAVEYLVERNPASNEAILGVVCFTMASLGVEVKL